MVIETERLILREFKQSDFQDLAELLQDPEVVYAYDHNFTDRDVQEWLERQWRRYQTCGYGLWALILKGSDEMVGQAGLTMQPYENQEVLEIGYLLKKRFWHCGFAREAAAACKNYAFETLGADRVHAIIKTDNIPSIHVAEAIGMERKAEFSTRYYGGSMRHLLFALDNLNVMGTRG